MSNIIFIAVEILLLGAGLYFVPFFTLVFMAVFSLLYLWFGFKIKKILYYIIPILFLGRVFFSVDFNNFENYYISNIKTNIIAGRGKIDKINKKFPQLFEIYFFMLLSFLSKNISKRFGEISFFSIISKS